MTRLLWLFAWFALLLWGLTENAWFALGMIGFIVGALANSWLEDIQTRVVRELSKTCMCPLCVANREKPDGDGK